MVDTSFFCFLIKIFKFMLMRDISYSSIIIDRLRKIVGEDNVLDTISDLVCYEADANPLTKGMPNIVVLPGSEVEVIQVLKLLSSESIAVIPRGAGTGLSGGAVAYEGGVVVSLARMDKILEVSPLGRWIKVEPGVVNTRLLDRLKPLGLFYAPDPSSQIACTLGGNVATNAGGAHCLKYGVTSNHVLGMRVATVKGDVLDLCTFMDEPYYPDLRGLIVGSEGTLGLVTQIKLSILDEPAFVKTLLCGFESMHETMVAVEKIVSSGFIPAALEGMDRVILKAVVSSMPHIGYPNPQDVEVVLIIEFDDYDERLLSLEFGRIMDLIQGMSPVVLKEAKTHDERELFWKGRKGSTASLGFYGPYRYMMDCVVPRSRLAEAISGIKKIREETGLVIGCVFHAGDGNMHPSIITDPTNKAEMELVKDATDKIMRLCVSLGGVIAGEHGVGYEKKSYMSLMYSKDELECFASLKRAFDQGAILNPGKVIPNE